MGAGQYDPTILTDDTEDRTPYIVYGRRTNTTPYYIARLNDDMLHLAEVLATLSVL